MARILVIDDAPVMRDFLMEFLVDAGHDVDIAGTGEDGLQKALAGEYDVCICDMHMPRMSGYDVLDAISPHKPSLQIIFTDSLPGSQTSKIRIAGDYPCLKKPFDIDQLRSALDGILKPVKNR